MLAAITRTSVFNTFDEPTLMNSPLSNTRNKRACVAKGISATSSKKIVPPFASSNNPFLDEVGEMPAELQARLLRVLETGEFIKVGDTKTLKVNVRIIAATNRNLQQEIETGHFRSDLFYRLSVFQISLPALRERLKDVPVLANYFTAVFAAKTNKAIPGLQKDYLLALQQYNWPGNIRELKNSAAIRFFK